MNYAVLECGHRRLRADAIGTPDVGAHVDCSWCGASTTVVAIESFTGKTFVSPRPYLPPPLPPMPRRRRRLLSILLVGDDTAHVTGAPCTCGCPRHRHLVECLTAPPYEANPCADCGCTQYEEATS